MKPDTMRDAFTRLFDPRLLVLLTIVALRCNSSFASIIISPSPKFGAPLVLSNRLIFTWPDASKPKLICINRQTGSKNWESPVSHNAVELWRATKKPLVAVLSNLFELNPVTGELDRRFETSFNIERIGEVSSDLLLLKCQSEHSFTNILLAVNAETWRIAWTQTNVCELLDANSQRVLVQFGQVDLSPSNWDSPHALPYRNLTVALLDTQNGRILWQTPAVTTFISQTALLADNYVALSGIGRIACLSVHNGALLQRTQCFPQNSVATIWREGAGIFTDLSSNLVATIDLPSLSTTVLIKDLDLTGGPYEYIGFTDDVLLTRALFGTKAFNARTGQKLWPEAAPPKFGERFQTDAHWAWQGVHEGFIYISRAESSQHKTFIDVVDIKTGKSRELYSSAQPQF